MRIFDALNDVDNIKSSIRYIKKYHGLADCAVCYTVDPHFSKMERMKSRLKGKPLPKEVFTDEYFLNKAKEMVALGADIITIKDMSGLIQPSRITLLIPLFKKHLNVPIDFHTHCTPGWLWIRCCTCSHYSWCGYCGHEHMEFCRRTCCTSY